MRSKRALHELNVTEESKTAKQKTFICLGLNRGGTSSIAGTMLRLGIPMGEDLPNNYEDNDFLGATSEEHKIETVKKRNDDYDVWGWKFPNAGNYIEKLLPYLRNPHIIMVSRDPVSICQSRVLMRDENPLRAYHTIMLQQQSNWFLLERLRVPTALVSYETAMLRSEPFIESLAAFLGTPLPADQAEIMNFLKPGSYKGLDNK